MSFHRLVIPVYAGGLRAGDDYINNAVAGTPAPAALVLASGTYVGSYFFTDGEQVTGAAINRGFKALAENCDYLDDELVGIEAAYTAADAVVASNAAADTAAETANRTRERSGPRIISEAAGGSNTLLATDQLVRIDAVAAAPPANIVMPDPSTCVGKWFVFYANGSIGGANYILMPAGAETFNDGLASYALAVSDGRWIVFTPDGVNWVTMALLS